MFISFLMITELRLAAGLWSLLGLEILHSFDVLLVLFTSGCLKDFSYCFFFLNGLLDNVLLWVWNYNIEICLDVGTKILTIMLLRFWIFRKNDTRTLSLSLLLCNFCIKDIIWEFVVFKLRWIMFTLRLSREILLFEKHITSFISLLYIKLFLLNIGRESWLFVDLKRLICVVYR